MDGILIIDKPAGITSHDVVSRVRRTLKTRRVGHTGTLDPFATGVLVLVVGKATRLAKYLDKDVKEYLADVNFGFETDTGDVTGKPKPSDSESGMRNVEVDASNVEWEGILSKFRGEILQTPPMYSAKKVDGRKLYELAREGEEIERKPIRITIHRLEISQDESETPHSTIRLDVACSAGTYVRTLAEDIGREIGVGAHLTALRRIAGGAFRLEDAISLEAFEELADPASTLLPLERAVSHLPEFVLPKNRVEATSNGLPTRADGASYKDGEHIRLVNGGRLTAVGVYSENEKSIRPTIVLN